MSGDLLKWLAHPGTVALCVVLFCLVAYVLLVLPETDDEPAVPADGWNAFAHGYGLIDNPYKLPKNRAIWASQWHQARHADGLSSE